MTGSTISRPQMSTAFVGFLLIGMASGAWGVLLPGLSAYYHVGRSVVGLLFFASATGYVLSALGTGLLTAKLGQRWYLVIGTALFMLCYLSFSLKPPFVLALLIRLFQGMAGAMIEAGLIVCRNTWVWHAFAGFQPNAQEGATKLQKQFVVDWLKLRIRSESMRLAPKALIYLAASSYGW